MQRLRPMQAELEQQWKEGSKSIPKLCFEIWVWEIFIHGSALMIGSQGDKSQCSEDLPSCSRQVQACMSSWDTDSGLDSSGLTQELPVPEDPVKMDKKSQSGRCLGEVCMHSRFSSGLPFRIRNRSNENKLES